MSIKVGGITIANNTLLTSNSGFISLRSSGRCTLTGNWLRNGSYIQSMATTM